ncbi:SDR family oxidoreductase [Herpetosiphon gulosus]|uniref:3-oxoacyl-[acyl-carrier-protein] reductase FabG n=1 Tax=Herpetosiphon gulosus TaxID=1973496 RepID=A0ABP9X246_9CHLR
MSNGWAIVTGGARRLGKSIALELARAGYNLIIHYNAAQAEAEQTCSEVQSLGREAWAYSADLRDVAAIETMFQTIGERCGTLAVLVNSAADFPRTPIGSISQQTWDDLVALNQRAPFFCAQAAAKLMPEHGVIVNIADVGGEVPWPSFVPYGMTKAALIMMTRGLALALAPNVRVGAVGPGVALLPDGWQEDSNSLNKIPLKRLGVPEDIAKAVRFIVESPYFTGETIFVDGGRRWA